MAYSKLNINSLTKAGHIWIEMWSVQQETDSFLTVNGQAGCTEVYLLTGIQPACSKFSHYSEMVVETPCDDGGRSGCGRSNLNREQNTEINFDELGDMSAGNSTLIWPGEHVARRQRNSSALIFPVKICARGLCQHKSNQGFC